LQSTNSTTRVQWLPNGMTVVGEPMPDKRVAAWAFLIPAGSATEPAGRDGITNVLEGLCYRGAGARTSRELSDALDDLGIDRGGGADSEYTTFGGATLGDYLADALTLYTDIIRRPRLPEDEWQAQRDLALQALDSLEDAPARKMFVHLRGVYFPNAYGRSPLGTRDGLHGLTLEGLRADHATRFRPDGAIVTLAGNFDFDRIVEHISALFADWQGTPPAAGQPVPVVEPTYQHVAQDTSQEQIGVASAGVPSDDPTIYDYRVATAILSGGMGARLFTEVREKRGLVYSVSAGAHSYRGCGFSLAYAGTTPERSQETLDVLLGELQRIAEGVSEGEVERAKVKLLSGLVMQQESSRARAAAIARDQFILGRVRSLDEITAAIHRVTPHTIAAFYEAHPPGDFTVVTLGPKELQVRV